MDTSVENSGMENATPRRRNLRPVGLIIGSILIVAAVFAVLMIIRKPRDNGSDTDNNTGTSENKTDEKSKEKTDDKPEEKSKEESKDQPEEKPEDEVVDGKTPTQQDGDNPNNSEEITGVINYAESDGETLMIRVLINQYLDTGECLLELTAPNDSFSLSDTIAPSAATSSCSYDIATSLLVGGKYDIKITVKSGNKNGIIKGEVNV